jgi:arginine/lysine/ornithine decarboxylase
VRAAMSLLMSTSPNQLLLASLDIARLQMAEDGKRLVDRAVSLASGLRRAINDIAGLSCLDDSSCQTSGSYALDLTKLTVSVRGLGISGREAEAVLRHRYKIQCELSDAYNVLFIISYADTRQETMTLLRALRDLAASYSCRRKFSAGAVLPPVPPCHLSPREAFFAPVETIPFGTAGGRVAAEQIMFYPPGIPLICPGEEITVATLDYIKAMRQLGLKVVGPKDTGLKTLQVVKER